MKKSITNLFFFICLISLNNWLFGQSIADTYKMEAQAYRNAAATTKCPDVAQCYLTYASWCDCYERNLRFNSKNENCGSRPTCKACTGNAASSNESGGSTNNPIGTINNISNDPRVELVKTGFQLISLISDAVKENKKRKTNQVIISNNSDDNNVGTNSDSHLFGGDALQSTSESESHSFGDTKSNIPDISNQAKNDNIVSDESDIQANSFQQPQIEELGNIVNENTSIKENTNQDISPDIIATTNTNEINTNSNITQNDPNNEGFASGPIENINTDKPYLASIVNDIPTKIALSPYDNATQNLINNNIDATKNDGNAGNNAIQKMLSTNSDEVTEQAFDENINTLDKGFKNVFTSGISDKYESLKNLVNEASNSNLVKKVSPYVMLIPKVIYYNVTRQYLTENDY
ncbi:MAG: hypothetical protein WCL51_02245 [Bacteroidota bacterium]